MHARKTHGLRYPLKWYQKCPSTKSKTCLGMIQVSRKKMLCAKRQRVGFCRGFFWRHEKKWKNTALHPWSNKHHKHPPSCSLPSSWHRIAKNYIRRSIWGWEALWSGWRREPQVAEAAEFLSLSLSFQNLPNLFGWFRFQHHIDCSNCNPGQSLRFGGPPVYGCVIL